jgi:acetoin utilization deacetylase AcuC-like enzyme
MTTGYVYDDICLKHNQVGHPENRARLEQTMSLLQKSGMLDRLTQIPARPATMEELTRVHRSSYVQQVRAISERGGGHLDPDTYMNQDSYQAALMAAGGLVDATVAVIDGRVDNAFALVRPPGHHAMPAQGMGFCLFGNVVVAAQAARLDRGLDRVLIVDFDVHHGNGTQAMTEEDPAICFISTHQYPYYPGTGAAHEMGRGGGKGSVVNLPLSPGAGDRVFRELYEQVVIPVARRFGPDLILVSAGFDAHWDDPLAGLALSLQGYAWLAQTLVDLAGELCKGRIVFTLEGGYHLEVLRHAILNTFHVLLGDAMVEDPVGPSRWREPETAEYVAHLRQLHGLDLQPNAGRQTE